MLNFTPDRRADSRATIRLPQGLHVARFRLSFQRTGGEVETKKLNLFWGIRVWSGKKAGKVVTLHRWMEQARKIGIGEREGSWFRSDPAFQGIRDREKPGAEDADD